MTVNSEEGRERDDNEVMSVEKGGGWGGGGVEYGLCVVVSL